jgi:von Willebrand factor type A domain
MSDRKPSQSILQKPRNQSVLRPQSKLAGRADVVFVLDRSGSMSPIFDRVRDWIADFVAGMASGDTQPIGIRYGFLCYNALEFHRLGEFFSESTTRFGEAIRRVGASDVDETTLPAIDAAADFPWSDNGHRFLIVLTDEATATGHNPAWQRSRVDALKEKLIRLRVKLWLAAPDCPAFREFAGLPNFEYRIVAGHDFEDPSWLSGLMLQMGNKVSILSRTRVQAAQNVPHDLYDLAGAGIRILTV